MALKVTEDFFFHFTENTDPEILALVIYSTEIYHILRDLKSYCT